MVIIEIGASEYHASVGFAVMEVSTSQVEKFLKVEVMCMHSEIFCIRK